MLAGKAAGALTLWGRPRRFLIVRALPLAAGGGGGAELLFDCLEK